MFDRITVIPNEKKDPDGRYTARITEYFKGRGCDVRHGTPDENTSLAVVLGGDGSILRAAGKTSELGIPLLGVNLGRVGYMAEIEADDLASLDLMFEGKYRVESRMMLDVSILRGIECLRSMTALNDAVISNGAVARMVDIALDCDGVCSGMYHADGLIVATPTGSTAYSLSAGGPVVDPALDCFCVTPVSAHSLGARPMIFSATCELAVYECGTRESEMYLTVDGSENIRIERGSRIVLRRSDKVTKLIRIKNNGFYDTLIKKMSDKDMI